MTSRQTAHVWGYNGQPKTAYQVCEVEGLYETAGRQDAGTGHEVKCDQRVAEITAPCLEVGKSKNVASCRPVGVAERHRQAK